jgi:PilZ domain
MLLAVGTRLDPYSLVALDIFFQRNPEPIHALGEVRWVRGGEGRQEREVGIKFIVMQAQERAR